MQPWYRDSVAWYLWPLFPLSLLVRKIATQRRVSRNKTRYPKPVIVIGNITVGGTGKTPMIQAITRVLQQRGLKVGIVSRGYGGKSAVYPLVVTETTPANVCGDEPKLLANTLLVPVVVDANRHQAVLELLANFDVDVVISDDGLQHYKMARDLEVVMVDGKRGLGNNKLLPLGPLREPVARLKDADFIVAKASEPKQIAVDAVALVKLEPPVNCLQEKLLISSPVEVVTAIGDGENFTESIKQLGYQVLATRYLADHDVIPLTQLNKQHAIVITEKDAVKLDLTEHPHVYVAAMSLELPTKFIDTFWQRIEEIRT